MPSPSPELVALARVEDRIRAGGHAIPEEVVRRRYRAGLQNFFQIYQPLATRWQVYDNSSESANAPRLVARGRGEATGPVVDAR